MIATTARSVPSLRVRVVRDVGDVVVAPSGEIDIASAPVLERELRALAVERDERLVIDLRAVDFLDSSGLRLLIALRNTAKRAGWRLVVVPGPARVQRIFDLTGTRGLFDWRM